MKQGDIYARKGEHVTCPNGHVVCTIARDIRVGEDSGSPEMDFTDWCQPEPTAGTPTKDIRCTVCGKHWILNHEIDRLQLDDKIALKVITGPVLCIEGEWRAPESFSTEQPN